MTHTATISSKGQITLPAELRRQFKLHGGDTIIIVKRGNAIQITPNDWKQGLDTLQKEVAAHLKRHHIQPLGDEALDEAINEAAAEAATKRYERDLR